jgi:hypothetical protein
MSDQPIPSPAHLATIRERLEEMTELLESDTARWEPIFTVAAVGNHINSLLALVRTWEKDSKRA